MKYNKKIAILFCLVLIINVGLQVSSINIKAENIENYQIIYSEDFASEPAFTSQSPENVYWDSNNENYYVKIIDVSSGKGHYEAYSPRFDTIYGNFSLEFDFTILNPDWGNYPGISFINRDITDESSKSGYRDIFRFDYRWSDHVNKKFGLYDGGDMGGYGTDYQDEVYYTALSPNSNQWYHIELNYDNENKEIDWLITKKSGDNILHSANNIEFDLDYGFNQFYIGMITEPPSYGDWSDIRVDNIEIKKLESIKENLITHWSFDDISNPGYDDSGNGHDGLNYGASWISDGVCGGAMSFDGMNDYLERVEGLSGISDKVSVCAWVKKSDSWNGYEKIVVTNKLSGYHEGMFLSTGPESQLYFGLRSVMGDINSASKIIPAFEMDVWHLLVGTYDGYTIKFYYDGELKSSIAQSGDINTLKPLRIGASWSYSGELVEAFRGFIDEVKIYNYALSASEIQKEYEQYMTDSDLEVAILKESHLKSELDAFRFVNSITNEERLGAFCYVDTTLFINILNFNNYDNVDLKLKYQYDQLFSDDFAYQYQTIPLKDEKDENGEFFTVPSSSQLHVMYYGSQETQNEETYTVRLKFSTLQEFWKDKIKDLFNLGVVFNLIVDFLDEQPTVYIDGLYVDNEYIDLEDDLLEGAYSVVNEKIDEDLYDNMLQIVSYCPVDLKVYDETNHLINEDENVIYSGKNSDKEFLIFDNSELENHTIKLIGTGEGDYTLSINRICHNESHCENITGNISSNKVVEYSLSTYGDNDTINISKLRDYLQESPGFEFLLIMLGFFLLLFWRKKM